MLDREQWARYQQLASKDIMSNCVGYPDLSGDEETELRALEEVMERESVAEHEEEIALGLLDDDLEIKS
jgi:hypothetical protein